MEPQLITHCDCADPSHIMSFFYLEEKDPMEDELYVHVQLNPYLPWGKRLWVAFKYILGKRSRYSFGHWDEGSLSRKSAKELGVVLEKFVRRGII